MECVRMLKMTFSLPMRKGEHNVENFMVCSFAHHACSPLLQGFLHEKELSNVVLTCPCSVGVLFFSQD